MILLFNWTCRTGTILHQQGAHSSILSTENFCHLVCGLQQKCHYIARCSFNLNNTSIFQNYLLLLSCDDIITHPVTQNVSHVVTHDSLPGSTTFETASDITEGPGCNLMLYCPLLPTPSCMIHGRSSPCSSPLSCCMFISVEMETCCLNRPL